MVADLESADELAGDCAVGRPLLFAILFIYFSVTIKRILTCGISLDSEKESLSKYE
jgi:hypothetical protein